MKIGKAYNWEKIFTFFHNGLCKKIEHFSARVTLVLLIDEGFEGEAERGYFAGVSRAWGFVVEDNFGSRKLLTVFLGKSGYDIAEAANGIEALDRAHETQPDLIILDLELPGISGDEVTRRLKADASTSHIPVIYR